jgi:ribulose kinase
MTVVLGLDFGTNGARAGVFDIGSRRMLAAGEEGYATTHIPPDRTEQNPDDWWRAAQRLLPRVLAAAGTPGVSAVTVATFSSTVVVCDREGVPIRPAILWMDARAWAEAARTARVSHPVMDYSGGSDAVEWLVPKAMWLKTHEPETWSRGEVICEALDWVNHRLTGRWAGSLMNATCKWNYDSRARRFCPELYEAFGIPELIDRLPPEILEIGAPIGRMTADAAAALGLSGRPLVVQGGIDAHMGAFGADTVAPGSMLLIGGTSNVHLTQVPDDGTRITGVWGPYPHALTPGLRMIEGGQVSAGSILNWLVRDIYGLDGTGFAALNAAAGAIPPRATGLLALDYWMGNRTPYRDPNLRGAILGLSLSHDRAGIYRACVNAIALGSANVVFDLARQGVAIERLVLAGGIMRNPLWLGATVDALGMPVGIAREDNLSLWGTAAAAAVGLGLHGSLTEAAGIYRAPVTVSEPDMDRHRDYRILLEDYRHATERLAPILRALSAEAGARP